MAADWLSESQVDLLIEHLNAHTDAHLAFCKAKQGGGAPTREVVAALSDAGRDLKLAVHIQLLLTTPPRNPGDAAQMAVEAIVATLTKQSRHVGQAIAWHSGPAGLPCWSATTGDRECASQHHYR